MLQPWSSGAREGLGTRSDWGLNGKKSWWWADRVAVTGREGWEAGLRPGGRRYGGCVLGLVRCGSRGCLAREDAGVGRGLGQISRPGGWKSWRGMLARELRMMPRTSSGEEMAGREKPVGGDRQEQEGERGGEEGEAYGFHCVHCLTRDSRRPGARLAVWVGVG